ncbi:MAG: alpha/beta hydrolase [Ilumatobacteraceae bacterium]
MATDLRITSSDDVVLSVHDYNPESRSPTVLFSHATGFHGRVFDPMAKELIDSHHCITFDYRGSGDSTLPLNWDVRWDAFGDDALTAAQHVTKSGAVVGFGHSMGGTALVMAALREPKLFQTLILFEPIIFPLEESEPDQESNGDENSLASGARRRRTTFASFDEAIANYGAKPPLNAIHPDSLSAYVNFGFRQQQDGTVTLKCSPEYEARTYETGDQHETWDQLANLAVPTWIISGENEGPAVIAPLIAAAITGAHFTKYGDLGHFGPMQDPHRFAELIRHVDLN